MANEYGLLGILDSPRNYGYSVQPQANIIDVSPSVTEKLDQLQATQRSPLSISSGYRSPGYNARVGGARRSQHMLGKAVDIDTSSMSREEVKSLISEASRVGFTGIGVYGGALHFDTGPRRAWGPNYSKTSVPGWAQDVIGAHIENKYQGTSPAPMVAKVERAQLPAVGPVLEAKPQMAVATPTAAPQRQMAAATPATKAFNPGGIIDAPNVSLSPVSSAQAAPARAAPAPSMVQSPARAAASVPAPNPSRFGTTAPNINEANALKSALEAQAAQISAPQNVSAISSLRSLAPTQQAAPAPTKAYSATPASYQTPAFSTAQPKVDAFGQPPAPGLQQVAQTQAPQQAMAPALAAPTRTIASPKVASVPAIEATPSTIGAPVDPALNQFPDRPKPGFGLLSPAQTTPAKIGQIAGALLGTAALGPVGGLVGGLLGKAGMNRFGGGLLDPYDGPTNNIGSGMQAVSSIMGGGMAPGSTAASASNGQTVTSLPGGGIQRTSKKYGWTEITTADGRTTRAKSTRGAGGNYGGVKSEKARDAIDKGVGGLF